MVFELHACDSMLSMFKLKIVKLSFIGTIWSFSPALVANVGSTGNRNVTANRATSNGRDSQVATLIEWCVFDHCHDWLWLAGAFSPPGVAHILDMDRHVLLVVTSLPTIRGACQGHGAFFGDNRCI